mgnify:FL=1
MIKKKGLIFLNLPNDLLSIFQNEFKNSHLFDEYVYCNWNEYNSEVKDIFSISSVIKFDKYCLDYIQGYKIQNYEAYDKIFKDHFNNYIAGLFRRTKRETVTNFIEIRCNHCYYWSYNWI